jgi:hypothetical protein
VHCPPRGSVGRPAAPSPPTSSWRGGRGEPGPAAAAAPSPAAGTRTRAGQQRDPDWSHWTGRAEPRVAGRGEGGMPRRPR